MKTFTKKTLSVVFAVLMALTSLTVGSMSALADTITYTPVAEGTTAVTADSKGYLSFTPSSTGYYNISVATTKTEEGKETKTASSSFKIYKKTDDNSQNEYGSYYSAEAQEFGIYSVNTVADEYGKIQGYDCKTVYAPAQTTLRLVKNTTYYIVLSDAVDTDATDKVAVASTITISGNAEYSYSYTDIKDKLTYNTYGYDWKYDSAKGESVKVYTDDYTTTTFKATVGIGVAINGYYGSATAITVPSTINGYAVKSVDLNVALESLKKRVTSVAIPEGVEEVGGMSYMYALTSVSLPSTVKTIDNDAFTNDTALTGRLTIAANVESIGSYAFYNTGFTSVEFLGTETEVGDYALGFKDVLNDATADPYDTTFGAVDGFFVVAPATSPAALYAVQNGFTAYDRANCNAGNHPYAVTTVAATLFAKGSTTSVCPVCGNTVKKSIKKKTFKLSSVKSSKKKTIVVKAKKQSGITGYQVQYSTSSKFAKKSTKSVKVKTTKALSKTVKGLKSGKKYYVRVRAYKTSGKKTTYSAWTAKKSVKVK